jgi:hypothetical protein
MRQERKQPVMPLETYAQNIVDTLREPLLMLDTTLYVHSANHAYYQPFQVSPAETEHHLIYELGNGQWDIPALRTLLVIDDDARQRDLLAYWTVPETDKSNPDAARIVENTMVTTDV